MNFAIAMARSAVGFKVQRPGHGYVTGTGQHDEADEYGTKHVQLVDGEHVEYAPSPEDEAATDWVEV